MPVASVGVERGAIRSGIGRTESRVRQPCPRIMVRLQDVPRAGKLAGAEVRAAFDEIPAMRSPRRAWSGGAVVFGPRGNSLVRARHPVPTLHLLKIQAGRGGGRGQPLRAGERVVGRQGRGGRAMASVAGTR